MTKATQPGKPTALVLALLAGLILAGCETADGQPTADEPPPQALDNSPAGPAMPYNGMATLPPVNADPRQLMGLDRAALNEKLGKPALVRRDGDAEVWQYRAVGCVLDLFLYGVDKKVEHVDLRDRGDGGGDSVRNCFAGMLRATKPSI